MAFKLFDRVRMTITTGGTGNLVLGAAVADAALGYHQTLAAAGAVDGDTFPYVIEDGSAFEWGIGTYIASGTSFSRSLIKSSTGSLLNVTTAAQMFPSPAAQHLPIGLQTIWIPAGAMTPRATSGAAKGAYDSGSNDITLSTMDFDTTTQEYAHFSVAMPKGWDEGTVTFIPYWTNTGGAATQNVVWSLAGRALGDNDGINGAFGTVQTSNDTWQAQNSLHIGPASAAITIGNMPAENDLVVFEVSRVVASDNMAGDASLIGIKLMISYNAGNDA
ncbi:hypothetical protein [Kaistia defluvii]|uniref:Uncharacterized protein n=1 Tax=Kaistia defluvii TaxID=410841 RepID=A0ABV2R112_9HYPH